MEDFWAELLHDENVIRGIVANVFLPQGFVYKAV